MIRPKSDHTIVEHSVLVSGVLEDGTGYSTKFKYNAMTILEVVEEEISDIKVFKKTTEVKK